MSRYGAPTFNSLLKDCVLWFPGSDCAAVSGGGYDTFPIIPSGVAVTNNGTFTKTDLGNNKSVLNFDGSTNYISLTDNAAWDLFTNDFTISLWFKTNTTGEHRLVSQFVDANNFWLVDYYLNSPDMRLYIAAKVSGTTTMYYEISLSSHVNDTWYFITITKSGTTPGTWTMYLDGVSKTVTASPAFNGTAPALAAALNVMFRPPTKYYSGNLAHLMIFKGRALTQPEIKLLMNRTHPITGAGLMPVNGDYWRTS